MMILYAVAPNKSLTRIMRTEYVLNNEDPKWSKTHQTEYYFEAEQRFVIEVYDVDGTDNGSLQVNVQGFDFMGSCEFLLSQLMSAFNCTLSLQLKDRSNQPVHQVGTFGTKNKDNRSLVHIRGDQLVKTRNAVFFSARGSNLAKGGFFGQDDTQLQVIKIRPDKSEMIVWTSQTALSNNTNPDWGSTRLDCGSLTEAGDLDSQFILRVCRVKSGKIEPIGQVVKNLRQICPPQDTMSQDNVIARGSNISIDITDVKGKTRGQLIFSSWVIKEEYTFLDFVKGGIDFSMSVCVDFTGSNGDPRNATSLHYIHPGCRNQYIDTIRSIGTILANYCQKISFPLNGFGGFASIDGRQADTSHCFPLSLTTGKPFAFGIEDAVKTYCESLPRITLSGPTFFEHIIRSGTQPALRPYTYDYQHYQIILIITDGVINDFAKTVDAIVEAAVKPVSIIIVGVGGADFAAMDQLDGDGPDRLTSARLGPAKRDIVQFVPFMKFAKDPTALAREVLAEIPAQVQEFMSMHNIKPIERKMPALNAQGSVIQGGYGEQTSGGQAPYYAQ